MLQGIPQRDGGTLVEQNAHLDGSQGALLCVFQDSANLFQSHAGEPLDELRCQRTILEILEQCCNRDARTSKDPCSADTVWVAFDCGAGGPLNHRGDASTVASRRLTTSLSRGRRAQRGGYCQRYAGSRRLEARVRLQRWNAGAQASCRASRTLRHRLLRPRTHREFP